MSKVIVICGPTASGKTSLSIAAAKAFNAQVISADSMQIYREMNIGTAKPDLAERSGVVHHMMDIVSVTEDYNVSRYVSEASACIDSVLAGGQNVIITGGTGLYIDSLINNVNFFEFDNDQDYRAELSKIVQDRGGEELVHMLYKVDPDSASRLHKNDVKRLIRALEVYKVTGKTLTQLHMESKQNRKYQPIFIALNYSDRQRLYDRINKRVDIMFESGLEDEARSLYGMELSSTARAAIGYSDVFDYFEGKISLYDATENIKKKSRNYAKRQITWFKKNDEIKWFFPDMCDNIDSLNKQVLEHINNHLR